MVTAALGVAAIVAAGLFDHLGRHRIFFYDEWSFVLDRRELSLASYLEPHNGHLSTVPVGAYQAFMAVFGAEYRPYRWAAIAVHLLCVWLLYVLLKRRVWEPAAAALAVVFMFLGSGWQNILWPFQIGFMGSVAAALGAVLLVEEQQPSLRRRIAAAGLLVVSLASSGLGVPLSGGLWLSLAVQRRWHDLVPFSAPAAVYGVWYLAFGESQADLGNLADVPIYVVRSAGGAAAGLANVSMRAGYVLAALVVAATLVDLVARRALSPRVALAVGWAGIFWCLTALSRGELGEPAASRYVYVGAIPFLILITELARRALPAAPSHHQSPRPRDLVITCALMLVAAVAVSSNVKILRAGAAGLRDNAEVTAAELSALEAAGSEAPARYQPDANRMPQVTAGRYLDAVEDIGPSGLDPRALLRSSRVAREEADRVYAAAGLVGSPREREPDTSPPSLLRSHGVSVQTSGACLLVSAASAGGSVEFVVPRAGAVIDPDLGEATVYVRRFADEFRSAPDAIIRDAIEIERPESDDWPGAVTVRIVPTESTRICA